MFEQVVGQSLPKEMLKTAIQTGKLNHAYIFHVKKGVGKTTLALEFAKAILCENHTACGDCPSCKQFYSTSDVKIIESEKSIPVETVRELTSEIFLKPFHFPRKIYLIKDADKMTVQAQNALLKVFEEPPSYAIIILITSNLSALLPTILSRGTEVRFPPLTPKELKEYFKNNKLDIPSDEILSRANGSVTEALLLSKSDDSAKIGESVGQTILSFLEKKTTASMLKLYQDFLTYQEQKEQLFDLFYSFVYDTTVTDHALKKHPNQNGSVSLSLATASNIYRALSQLVKRTASNADYGLTVLTFLIEVRNHLMEERNF